MPTPRTTNSGTRPDCPREYQDDYAGREAGKEPDTWLLLVGAATILVAAAAGAWLLL